MNQAKDAIQALTEKIVDLDLEESLRACRTALSIPIDPLFLLDHAIGPAVDQIGNLFEKDEFFLPELIFAGEILTQVIALIHTELSGATHKRSLGKIVIATAKGDLHDIGKNIVKSFLDVEGFEIIDLGVDVTATAFIDAIRTHQPKIVAISALLTSTMLELENIMKQIEAAGMRHSIKIILGGAPMTQAFADKVRADAYGKNAIDGVKICKRWAEL